MLRLIAASLLTVTLSASVADAGKLSGVREAVRHEPTPAAKKESDKKDDDESGKLGRVRSEVRQASNPRKTPRRGSRGHHAGRFHRSGSRGSNWLGFHWFPHHPRPCTPAVTTYVYEVAPPLPVPPVGAPVVVLPPADAPLTPAFARRFAAFPYADGAEGFMLTADVNDPVGKPWLGQVNVEFGGAGDGVDRTGFGFLLEGDHGFGVDFDWNTFTEELPGGGHDELHLGEINLLYRVVETDQALVRVGIGAAWLGDRYATDGGVNLTLKADLTPCDPLILSGELELGTLGDAQTLHAAGTAGVVLGRCELFGGYDYRRIGDVELKGPMVGLRLWW